MTLGDILQIVIGVVAIVATVVVARLVYRLERRDKGTERAEQRLVEQETEARRRSDLSASETRTVRREQYSDDYRRAIAALDIVQRVFDEIQRGPLDKAALEDMGIDGALEDVKSVGGRVDELNEPLGAVWSAGMTVRTEFFPGPAEFRYALSADVSRQADALLAQIHHAVRSGIRQTSAAEGGAKAIDAARAAIDRDWTGSTGDR